MGVVGADVDQLRILSRAVSQAADQLETMSNVVTSMLSATRWSGPDAERHRSQWHGTSVAQVRAVAQALRESASELSRNAEEQATASAETAAASDSGVRGPTTSANISESLAGRTELANPAVNIRDFLNSNAAWPITWGTLIGPLDKYGVLPLLDALGLASDTRLTDEQRMVAGLNSMTDLAGGLLGAGGTLPSYLSGLAVTQWGDVVAQLSQADFSPSTLLTNADYIASDPAGAFDAAATAVVDYLPKLFSNVLPW